MYAYYTYIHLQKYTHLAYLVPTIFNLQKKKRKKKKEEGEFTWIDFCVLFLKVKWRIEFS